jgi:hypothetical protein
MWATSVIISLPLRLALPGLAHFSAESVAHFTGIRNAFGDFVTYGEFTVEVTPSGKDLYERAPKGGKVGF